VFSWNSLRFKNLKGNILNSDLSQQTGAAAVPEPTCGLHSSRRHRSSNASSQQAQNVQRVITATVKSFAKVHHSFHCQAYSDLQHSCTTDLFRSSPRARASLFSPHRRCEATACRRVCQLCENEQKMVLSRCLKCAELWRHLNVVPLSFFTETMA